MADVLDSAAAHSDDIAVLDTEIVALQQALAARIAQKAKREVEVSFLNS